MSDDGKTLEPSGKAVVEVVEKRSHKRLHPEIKALRAINRALAELPDVEQQRRVMEWTVARGLSKTWFSLPRFRWMISGESLTTAQAPPDPPSSERRAEGLSVGE